MTHNVTSLYEYAYNKEVTQETLDWDEVPEIFEVSLHDFLNHFLTDDCYPSNLKHPTISYTLRESDTYREYYRGKHAKYLGRPYIEFATTQEFIGNSRQELQSLLANILQLEYVLFLYNVATKASQHIKHLKILIQLNYLICWLYILVVSLPSLNPYESLLFKHYKMFILTSLYKLTNSKAAIITALYITYLYDQYFNKK